MKRNYYTRLLN